MDFKELKDMMTIGIKDANRKRTLLGIIDNCEKKGMSLDDTLTNIENCLKEVEKSLG